MNSYPLDSSALSALKKKINIWGNDAGFQQMAVSDINLSSEGDAFRDWLKNGFHGSMAWMEQNIAKRLNPSELLPGSIRVISARMNYFPPETEQIKILKSPENAYISRYALGRDYHKLIRKKLSNIASLIEKEAAHLAYEAIGNTEQTHEQFVVQRAFVDSAPVLERALATKAGLGWTGKHTLLIEQHTGSWFFLGEIYTNIPIPVDNNPQENKCGDCAACLKVCPTDAFPKPYQLDARRCISYLTIENKHEIPVEFREPMGNRIFGCDDCQAICPWNKYAKTTQEADFYPRHQLDKATLLELFGWSETDFLKKTEGSAIRRIGYEGWQRNLAVALGNATKSKATLHALKEKYEQSTPLVKEHISWAIDRQESKRPRKRKISREF